VQARLLSRALPARLGQTTGPDSGAAGAKFAGTYGLEAALVSSVVDLGPGDFVSDALDHGVVEFLHGAGLSEVLRQGKTASSRMSGRGIRNAARGEVQCATAARLSGAPGTGERIWAALGAAALLKAQAKLARAGAKAAAKVESESSNVAQDERSTCQAGVAVVFALPGEGSAPLWKKALRFAAQQELPVVFVVLPAARARGRASTARAGFRLSALAQRCGVPTITVDADDAVAIYRVVQESIGHARIGGGAALLECIPFALQNTPGKGKATEDAIAGLERYMEQRGVASRAWMEREAQAFAKRLKR